MRITLLKIALAFSIVLSAQDGDTIATAIDVDGTDVDVNALDFNSATDSGFLPACVSSEDVFYRHMTDVGDNKMTIGMVSAGTTVITDIDYQIFVAPQNDMGQLQELDCDNYTVFVIAGGSFEFVIEDINTQNTYYLRVYKSNDIGGSLTDLLNGTSITMDSSFDLTLSTENFEEIAPNIIVNKNSLEVVNGQDFVNYKIYGIDGKLVQNSNQYNNENTIDIASLNKGIYILNLEGERGVYSHKFVKY